MYTNNTNNPIKSKFLLGIHYCRKNNHDITGNKNKVGLQLWHYQHSPGSQTGTLIRNSVVHFLKPRQRLCETPATDSYGGAQATGLLVVQPSVNDTSEK